MTIEITTATEGVIHTPRKTLKQKMRGFTLIELGIVLTIVAILALFAVPRVQSYLISGRVQPTASEAAAAINSMRGLASANTSTAQPYAGMTMVHFATSLRDRANALIPTVGTTAALSSVLHRLGATGSNVAFAPATITLLGDSFMLTFSTVNGAACADLAAALQVQARKVVVTNSASTASTVKDLDAATPAQYNALTAQSQCSAGDTNTLAFTFQ